MNTLLEVSAKDRLIDALIFADLKEGKGSDKQLEAYQELEWRKCSKSARYFIENYCYILLKSGKIAPFNSLFPCQIETIEMLEEGNSIIQVKARQLGQTTLISHYALSEILFKEGMTWNFFGADEDASKDIKDRLSATIDRLPDWLKERASATHGTTKTTDAAKKTPKKKNTKESTLNITFGISKINLYSGALKKVRGLSGKIFFDDYGKHENQREKFYAAYPAISDPIKENRGQMCIVFNGNGEDFCYDLYMRVKRGDIKDFVPAFYSWKADPRRLKEPIYDKQGNIISYEWYEEERKKYQDKTSKQGIMAFRAEYPDKEEEAFYVSNDCRFDLDLMNGIKTLARKAHPNTGFITPDLAFIKSKSKDAVVRLYDDSDINHCSYVIGMDAAGGKNSPTGDHSVSQVLRIVTGEDAIQKAYERAGWLKEGQWTIPRIEGKPAFEVTPNKGFILEQVAVYDSRPEPHQFAIDAAKLGGFFNEAMLVPEVNNHGETVISNLASYPYYNIFKRKTKAEHFWEEETERYGFRTETNTKPDLINTLAEYLGAGWLIVQDEKTIKELEQYRYELTPSGKVTTNAPKGQHDDHVMALALAVYGAAKDSYNEVYQPINWE